MKSSVSLAAMTIMFFISCANQKLVKTKPKGSSETTNSSLNHPIVNKYWKLISLNGQKVAMAENQQREIYFTLKTEDSRVTGFSGCNTFNGTYTLVNPGKIEFSQMLSTMMACPDVAVNESMVLSIFSSVSSYKVVGDSLWLQQGDKKQMATFAAIYFH